MMNSLLTLFRVSSQAELLWVLFGLFAQLLFTGRFLVQWLASERARKSVMPVAFWYFSMAGGIMLLAYAIHRRDPVFILGQALGVFIYARNLWLIHQDSLNLRLSGLKMSRGEGDTWLWQAIALVAGITLLRWVLLAFNRTDLFVDESQYWLWGQSFELGYYSKPPLIGWVIGAVTTLVGSDAPFWVRMPGAFFHAVTALILGALAFRLSGPRAAFWTSLAYVTLPAVGFGSLMFTTDTVMAPFFAAALLFHHRLVENGRWSDALLAGLMAGLACMAKYAGVYFLIGVAIAAFVRKDMRLSLANCFYLLCGFVVAISPNLVWNLLHGGVTFSHTADNIGWVRYQSIFSSFHIVGMLEFLGAQFLVAGPGLFAVLLVALFTKRSRLIAFVAPVLVIVTAQALMDRAIANWAASAYLAGTILVITCLQSRPALRNAVIGINAFLCILLPLLTIVPVNGPDGQPLLRRFMGREALSRMIIEKVGPDRTVPVVASDRSILADLFYTGRDAGLTIYAVPPQARPMNHYEQLHAMPSGLSGPVLLVTAGPVPACAGQGERIDTAGGAYSRQTMKIYRTDAACIASS